MADLTHRCHGNFPQRRATLNPRGEGGLTRLTLETMSPETGPDLAGVVEEGTLSTDQLRDLGTCEMEKPNCTGKSTDLSTTSREWERPPEKGVKALLRKIRIHPEAQRILGKSSIAVVALERLDFQSVSLSSLQPVVSLQRLPGQTHAKHHREEATNCPEQLVRQNGITQKEAEMFEISETLPELNNVGQAETAPTSWTEPVCPDSTSSEEPEQDSGFDCDSNPDLPFILFDSGSDGGKSDSETFYLDPDAKQAVVIELGPQTEVAQDRRLKLEDEATCEADGVQVEHSEDQSPDICCAFEMQLEAGGGAVEMESEDFCAVCLNGGELLCCDRCPKVFHVSCHIPPLISFPLGDWMCTLCRTDQEPMEAYDCEGIHSSTEVKAPYTLSKQNQRRCEKLCLLLYCHELSGPFHEPVSPLAQNYYQIIKRPINLSVIRRKLDESNTLHYFTPEQFVDDVLLMFKNCATFNYPDSEVAQAGRNLEEFFLVKLKEVFPEQTFPSATQDRTDRARLHWLSRKRKENYRRKRNVCSGKKYCL